MKPLIVVTDARRMSFSWPFVKFILWWYGSRSVRVTPNKPEVPQFYDGVILLGGKDINPMSYGGVSDAKIPYDTARDELEIDIVKKAKEDKRPILGICRGMQLINIALEGTLYEDVSVIYDNFFPTTSLIGKIFTRRKVRMLSGSRLCEILGGLKAFKVNSLHHQGIHKLGKNLEVCAWETNGLIQGIELSQERGHSLFLGVQWHPEFMLHRLPSRLLFWELSREAGAFRSLREGE